MVVRKNVHGTQLSVPEREVNVDTVYLRTNIHQIDTEKGKVWEYDEQQMTIAEYLKITVPKNEDTFDAAIAELTILFVEYQQKMEEELAQLRTVIEGGGAYDA